MTTPLPTPVFVATWTFGRFATEQALATVRAGGSLLDGVEAGIREVERRSCDGTVGLGGRPNAAGYVQLDACLLGPGRSAGAVAAVEGIVHPISAARAVLEHSEHVLLVGEGARWFALEHGVESSDAADLEARKRAWRERSTDPAPPAERGHDTVTLLGLDAEGRLCAGSSTSGTAGKWPGRVGDSPIPGAGLCVDDAVGAAGATGVGETLLRHSAAAVVVELMRQGLAPQEACERFIDRLLDVEPSADDLAVSVIALDRQGRHGAATALERFPFALTSPVRSAVHTAEPRRS